MPDISPAAVGITVKRYAAGKAFAFARGDPAFVAQVEKALHWALVIEARVDRGRFLARMLQEGVPEAAIAGYMERLGVADEAWLQDVAPG